MCQKEVPFPRGKQRKAATISLSPLYAALFLRTAAFAIATLPAYALRMHRLTLASGGDASSAAWSLGVAAALRYLAEHIGSRLLTDCTSILGCRPVLAVSCAALASESAAMAFATTPLTLGAVHVLGGLAFSAGSVESHAIANSALGSAQQGEAAERLLHTMGAAFVMGPCIGGTVKASYGGVAPFAMAHVVNLAAFFIVLMFLPEYMPVGIKAPKQHRRRSPPPAFGAALPGHGRSFPWYCLAMALSAMGMAAFGSTSALWMRASLRWDAVRIGDFIGTAGFCQVFAQVLALPWLAERTRGRETLAAQLCLGFTTARFIVLACFPDGRTYSVLIASSLGFCATPFLSALCLLRAPQGMQGVLTSGLPALNVAASAAGSLVGSAILARALEDSLSPQAPLLFAAAAHCLAGCCIAQGSKAERAAPPASVPTTTARPSLASPPAKRLVAMKALPPVALRMDCDKAEMSPRGQGTPTSLARSYEALGVKGHRMDEEVDRAMQEPECECELDV